MAGHDRYVYAIWGVIGAILAVYCGVIGRVRPLAERFMADIPKDANGNGKTFVSVAWLNNLLLYIVGAIILGAIGLLTTTLKNQSDAIATLTAETHDLTAGQRTRGDDVAALNTRWAADSEVWNKRYGFMATEINDLRQRQIILERNLAVQGKRLRVPITPYTPPPEPWQDRFNDWLHNRGN